MVRNVHVIFVPLCARTLRPGDEGKVTLDDSVNEQSRRGRTGTQAESQRETKMTLREGQ